MAPITEAFRDWDVQWLTSIQKESAYGTALSTALSDGNERSGLFKGPDFGEKTPEIITDMEQVGRGHDFPDSQVIHTWSTALTRNWDATLFWTLWAFAFAMGVDVMTLTGPYLHSLTFMEPTDGQQPPSTTIVEKIGTHGQREFSGMCVNDVTLTASGKNRLTLACSLLGSGRTAVNADTVPAATTAEYLRGSNVAMTVNSVDLQNYIKGWSLKVSQNLMADEGYVLGAAADLGLYRERLFYGNRSVELALTLLLPPSGTIDLDALLANQTNSPVVITATGDTIGNEAKFTLSNYKFTGTPKASDNNQVVINLAGTAIWTEADKGPLLAEITIPDEDAALLIAET